MCAVQALDFPMLVNDDGETLRNDLGVSCALQISTVVPVCPCHSVIAIGIVIAAACAVCYACSVRQLWLKYFRCF